MPDQRETLVRRMVEEGTSDDDIRATLKAFDVSPLRKPVSAEDFMRPEDIANRDNGTSVLGDLVKGAAKGLGRSVMGMGEMASTGIAESAARTAAQAAASVMGRPSPFNPVIRDPALVRVDKALTPTNDAQKVGGYMETAAELAPGAIGLAKAVPSLARGAVSLAKGGAEALARGAVSDTPVLTQVRQAVSRKLLGRLLDGGKAVDDIPQMLDELQPPASFTGTAATPPQTIAAPGGFSMPPSVPAKPVPPPPGRVVPAAPRVPVEDQLAASLAEVRQPAPVTVTTPPPAELPPGYTPRSTVPKPVRERMARQAKMEPEPPARAVEPPTTQPARRAYFLRSEEDMAAMRAPAEAVEPTGSITIDDLPEAWKSRTGQDLFPTTGAEAKEITAALRAEIKDRGMTIGQAIAAVSKNRNISTATRTQIVRSLSGGQ